MSPEYLAFLDRTADEFDPARLRRVDVADLPECSRATHRAIEIAYALQEYAAIGRQLAQLIGTDRSLLLTPTSSRTLVSVSIPTPEEYKP